MAFPAEMFRFVTTRPPERIARHRIESRLIRDLRPVTAESLLVQLFGRGPFPKKLETAEAFAESSDFVEEDDPDVRAFEPGVDFFRDTLEPWMALGDLETAFEERFPKLAALLDRNTSKKKVEETTAFVNRVWDSLYSLVVIGSDRFVSTNYLAILRIVHVLRLLWLSRKLGHETWHGGAFDEYEALIDTKAARDHDPDQQASVPDKATTPALPDFDEIAKVEQEIAEISVARDAVDAYIDAGAFEVRGEGSAAALYLEQDAAAQVQGHKALAKVDLAGTPVDQVRGELERSMRVLGARRQQLLAASVDVRASTAIQRTAKNAIAVSPGTAPAPAGTAGLGNPKSSFRVPLSVGDILPPAVGDLILVEQELRCYEMGELADVTTIMRGERRERSRRDLSRTTQTTTTETSSEVEESESITTDERFSLSSQAQQTAEQSFSLDTGVSVSGKFGPVQVGATANASYSTSKSATESTAQEYAKTVTEEASKRVRDSIKETSSITLLTETQTTTLEGFNNEKGSDHVNGLKRWIDKVYSARTLNYGRRLMLSFSVPEPAAFYRSLMTQSEAALLEGIKEPTHPSVIAVGTLEPFRGSGATRPGGSGRITFDSHHAIEADNYAELAALYDVTDIEPPPPEKITGSKAVSYPEAMEAVKVDEHDDKNELSYVGTDNTLSVDPDYMLSKVGVYAAKGESGGHIWYVDALKLGENKNKMNLILVQVGNKNFYLKAEGDGNNPKIIKTNFNTVEDIDEGQLFGGVVQTSLPVTITADFEGILTFVVIYTAFLRAEALERWRIATWTAILAGYDRKRKEYEQALALGKAAVQSEVEARTYQLRDDQYRAIELTELKRGCIDLLTEGTAIGKTSIAVDPDGSTRIVHDESEGSLIGNWRSPLSNGVVAAHFEESYDWENTTYNFYPYYWTDEERWKELAEAGGADPLFETFLKAGSANVLVPVKLGYERMVIYFLKTGLIWGGGYLPLFSNDEVLEVYSDVELAQELDPPEQIGEPWDIRVPTSMVILQEDDELPKFPVADDELETPAPSAELTVDESVPF